MHLGEAVFYFNYLYSRPYLCAAAVCFFCILLVTAGCCISSRVSIQDLVPLAFALALTAYMFD